MLMVEASRHMPVQGKHGARVKSKAKERKGRRKERINKEDEGIFPSA